MIKKSIDRPLAILAMAVEVVLLSIAPKYFGTGVLALFVYGFVRNFLRQARRAHWFTKWTMVRIIRRLRPAFLPSQNATACYAATVAFGMGAVIAIHFSAMALSPPFLAVSGFFLFLGTIIDWHGRLKYLLSSKPAEKLAWAILGFLGTATIFISTVLANHLLHGLSQANPAFTPEFVRVATTFIYPFSLTVVVTAVLTIVMACQSLLTIVVVVFTSILNKMLGQKVEALKYRLVTGERPPEVRPWWDRGYAGDQIIQRPFGTIIVIIAVAMSGQFALETAQRIPVEYLKKVLVFTEYHTPHHCENVPPKAAISYQDDGYVSLASEEEDGYHFKTMKCHKPS